MTFKPPHLPPGDRHRRESNGRYDAKRRTEQATRGLYATKRWQAIRGHQLATEPLCARCLGQGVIEPATIFHHVEPHRGDVEKFWSGPFASSCKPCHDVDEQRIENGRRPRHPVDEAGWPV